MRIERAAELDPEGLDQLLIERILFLARAMELDKAHDFMAEKFEELYEATARHAFSEEGGWAQDVHEILKRYPGWNVKFEKKPGGGMTFTLAKMEDGEIVSCATDESDLLTEEVQNAQQKYILIKGLREGGQPFDSEFDAKIGAQDDS